MQKTLLDTIIAIIDDKKGENIVSIDLRPIEGAICDYFVVCNVESTVAVGAIAGSIEEEVQLQLGEKVIRVDGVQNSLWVAMDYGDIVVHIFQTEMRNYYQLENLWADAIITDHESTI